MRIAVPDALAALEQKAAVQRFGDLRNLIVLYFAASLIAVEGIGGIVMWRQTREPAWLWVGILMPLVAFLMFRFGMNLRRGSAEWRAAVPFERTLLQRADANLRAFVIGSYLLVCAVAAVRWSFRPDDDPLLALMILGIALRISIPERLTVYTVLLFSSLLIVSLRPGAGLGGAETPLWESMTVYAVVSIASFVLGWHFTRRFNRAFLDVWRPQRRRLEEENRMREELDLARSIQLSMLPRTIPLVDGIKLAAHSIPATEVGGDFYDFFFRDGRFAVVQADVAGHGVGSGLVLSGIRTALRLLSEELENPRAMMQRLETLVRETRIERMLVTLCLVSIDPDRRSALVISAGHPPVFHRRSDGGEVDVVMLPSLPLGTGLRQPFAVARLSLRPGDRILLHTDGAYEMRDESGKELGIDGFAEIFGRASSDEAPDQTLRRIMSELDSFRGGGVQEDDVTLIVLQIGDVEGP